MRDKSDRGDGQSHSAECQADDRNEIVTQIAGRGVVGVVEQCRRDEQRQGELGVERDVGHSRCQGQRRTGEREQCRVGYPETSGPQGEQRADEQ